MNDSPEKLQSFMGALGIVLAFFAALFAITLCLNNFLEITVIANAFRGIKSIVSLLMLISPLK